MAEFSGSGDPKKSIALLWGTPQRRGRGRKARLTLDRIAGEAEAIVGDEGLDALSMRALADRLGVTPMALYAHVPSKAELLDVLVDRAYGTLSCLRLRAATWRKRLEVVARENYTLYLNRPWMLQISLTRPLLGPHALAKYQWELETLDGLGLTDLEMDAVLTLVLGYANSAARTAYEAGEVERRTGMSDAAWWAAHGPLLAEVVNEARYPLASRVGTAVGQAQGGPYDADLAFAFGLERVLDGVERLVQTRLP